MSSYTASSPSSSARCSTSFHARNVALGSQVRQLQSPTPRNMCPRPSVARLASSLMPASSTTCEALEQKGVVRSPEGGVQQPPLSKALGSVLCAAALTLSAGSACAKGDVGLDPNNPVYDGAGIIPIEREEKMSTELKEFEERTGWRIRVFTNYTQETAPPDTELRAVWGTDKRSLFMQVDTSNPNIIQFRQIGDEMLAKLRRPFWVELQSRFGNQFYVRDEGESEAVQNAVSTILLCLDKPEGCTNVPGLPVEQYYYTLGLSMIGGLVAGSVYRLDTNNFVRRRWVWLIIFSPIWASLFINFGLGPVMTRTDDLEPIIGNTLGFLVAAALVSFGPSMSWAPERKREDQ